MALLLSHPGGKIVDMKTIELHRWRLRCAITGRRYTSRHHMTRDEALALDPEAQPCPSTRELRVVAESVEERAEALYGHRPARPL